jgi:hypothetical protein
MAEGKSKQWSAIPEIEISDSFIKELRARVDAGRPPAFQRDPVFDAAIREIQARHEERMSKAIATPNEDRVNTHLASDELKRLSDETWAQIRNSPDANPAADFVGKVKASFWHRKNAMAATLVTPDGTRDVLCAPGRYTCAQTGEVVAVITEGKLSFGTFPPMVSVPAAPAPGTPATVRQASGPEAAGGLVPAPA